jgi:hypothetical protein
VFDYRIGAVDPAMVFLQVLAKNTPVRTTRRYLAQAYLAQQ